MKTNSDLYPDLHMEISIKCLPPFKKTYKFLVLVLYCCKKTDCPKAAEGEKRLCFLSSWLSTNTTQCMLGLLPRNVKHQQPSLCSGEAEDAQTKLLEV